MARSLRPSARTQRPDGEETYNRILETAGRLIAEGGFADLTSKTIAAEAGVDLASINYHFGSRGGLYQAVLAEAHRRLISLDDLTSLAATSLPATTKLRRIIEGLVASAIGPRGWHVRVLGREVMAASSHLQILQKNEILPKVSVMLTIISEISGIPLGDPALIRCMVSVAAPCAVLIVAGGETFSFAGEQYGMAAEAMVDHLHRFAIGGLEAVGRDFLTAQGASGPVG